MEKLTGNKIKNLQSDNGLEYLSNEFDDFEERWNQKKER